MAKVDQDSASEVQSGNSPSARCLTHAELVELTGRKYAKCQIKVLIARGWKFEVDGNDQPKVLRSYADARQGQPTPKRKGPRLDGLAAA